MPGGPDAFFLPVLEEDNGQRFCLYHPPQGAVQGAVLYVHPFAEEMNKSRRMAALQSRALSQAGYAVVQIDLLGCGDSSGDFADARWDAWLQDVLRGCAWLHARHPHAPLWLWGLRVGCLLAVEASTRWTHPCHFLFWAPLGSGRIALQQFLRLKLAEGMLSGTAKGAGEELRKQLELGGSVEIAGYTLGAQLAHGLERATVSPTGRLPREPSAPSCRLEWLDLSMQADAALSPVAQKATAQWERDGFVVRSRMVQGPAFWQTTEIEDAPELIAATLAAIAPLPQPPGGSAS